MWTGSRDSRDRLGCGGTVPPVTVGHFSHHTSSRRLCSAPLQGFARVHLLIFPGTSWYRRELAGIWPAYQADKRYLSVSDTLGQSIVPCVEIIRIEEFLWELPILHTVSSAPMHTTFPLPSWSREAILTLLPCGPSSMLQSPARNAAKLLRKCHSVHVTGSPMTKRLTQSRVSKKKIN